VIGHSFGGLLTQIVAGRGLSAASVAIDAATFLGVLPLPISSLKAAKPVLGNPAPRRPADQFRFAFANAVSELEARELYDAFAVPASGVPLFQAAAANLNPWSEAKVDTHNPDRGPLLNTVPRAISEAAYKHQLNNPGITEFVEMPGRGHAVTIDSGWREVASTSLAFIQRFV
jgi:non-heme chloroperoxidase